MFFDPFFFPTTTRVVVVSEERLREAERKAKQAEVEQLQNRIDAYEKNSQEILAEARVRLEELQGELKALTPAKQEEAS